MYIGIDNTARKTKGIYVGVDGVAHKVKKAYIGIDGVARLFWKNTSALPDVAPEEYNLLGEYYEGTTFTAPETGWYKIELISPSTDGYEVRTITYVNGESYYDGFPLVLKAGENAIVKFEPASCGGSGSCYAYSYVKLKENDTIVMNWISPWEIKAEINSSYGAYEDIGISMSNIHDNVVYGADYYEMSDDKLFYEDEHTIELITDWTNLEGEDDIVDTPYFRPSDGFEDYVVIGSRDGSEATKTCKELGLGANGSGSPIYLITTEFSDNNQTATIQAQWVPIREWNPDSSPEPFGGCFRISKGIL